MKRNFSTRGNRGGFTLIEILVVLVIMGFLVAMVAPKLSGIVDSAVDTACDTNQERLRTVLNGYVNQSHGLPGGLVNMVVYNDDAMAAANVGIPDGDDSDKANGREFLSSELVERMKPQVHFLDTAEAAQLVGMGIKNVYDLAKVTALSGAGSAEEDNIIEGMVRKPVQTDLPVFMIGVGATDAAGGGTLTWADGQEISVTGSVVAEGANAALSIHNAGSTNAEADGTFVRFDEAQNIGRIVMGISNKGELIQNGMLEEAGTCPGQIQRADQHTWGNYLIVLPRLSATMDRLDSNSDDVLALHAVALDVETGDSAEGAKIIGRTEPAGLKFFDEQTTDMFTTSCPEGHTWGAVADSYAVAIQD